MFKSSKVFRFKKIILESPRKGTKFIKKINGHIWEWASLGHHQGFDCDIKLGLSIGVYNKQKSNRIGQRTKKHTSNLPNY